jgi:hypothetical protein
MKDSYLQVAPAHRSGAASIPPLPPVWVGFGLAAASFFAELASAALPDARVGLVLVPLAGSIYWLACIYRFHSVIRAWSNETYAIKPAMALFGNFIPIFNIYWMVKWPIEMSTYINRQSSIHLRTGRCPQGGPQRVSRPVIDRLLSHDAPCPRASGTAGLQAFQHSST